MWNDGAATRSLIEAWFYLVKEEAGQILGKKTDLKQDVDTDTVHKIWRR